jgi:hypothetical protein
MPLAFRASAVEEVAEREIPRTCQPRERKYVATEPPCFHVNSRF